MSQAAPCAERVTGAMSMLSQRADRGAFRLVRVMSIDFYSYRRPTTEALAALGAVWPQTGEMYDHGQRVWPTVWWAPLGATCTDQPLWLGECVPMAYRTTLRFGRKSPEERAALIGAV